MNRLLFLPSDALFVPPDDTVRTPAEIAAGTNHSSEYYVARPDSPTFDLKPALTFDALAELRSRVDRGELHVIRRELLSRIEEIESVILDLAVRAAALERGRRVA